MKSKVGRNFVTFFCFIYFYIVIDAAANIDPAKRPNIIFILADDMGYSDYGFIGGDIQTPVLDNLAANGIVFKHMFNHAKCEPSRASLMTGVHYARQTSDHVVREFRNVTTIAECLENSGYFTIATGKWHLPGDPKSWGFIRNFGLLGGTANNFDPTNRNNLDPRCHYNGPAVYSLNGKQMKIENNDFYCTNAYTKYAIDFINECPAEKPFFLYLAYTAPHFPLQAPENVINKYLNSYTGGWDSLRNERIKHMNKSGIFGKAWSLSVPDKDVTPWKNAKNKADAARCMAVHAAMVDCMDQNIGKLIQVLKEKGELDNTLIFFMSDNGISSQLRFDRTPEIPAGSEGSYRHLPLGFANAANTPLKKYKIYNSNGGICTPMIVAWPKEIRKHKIMDKPLNILDVMPTILDIAGAAYPDSLVKLDGRICTRMIKGGRSIKNQPMYFVLKYSETNQEAIIDWPWKALNDNSEGWQLFNLKKDMTENIDISKERPHKTKILKTEYYNFEKSTTQLHSNSKK